MTARQVAGVPPAVCTPIIYSCIYIYIYIYTTIYIYIHLSFYIYIYIHIERAISIHPAAPGRTVFPTHGRQEIIIIIIIIIISSSSSIVPEETTEHSEALFQEGCVGRHRTPRAALFRGK